MDKIIFHLDLNYFFCRCEEIVNPQLANRPFAVSERTQRSVVATSNPAARKLGVHAAVPLKQALQICPQLTIIEVHRDLYTKFSYAFFDCLRTYFTNQIEIMSIDECYLDATLLIRQYHNNYKILAQTIINKVYEITKLYVTVGVGNNKIQAKMAGDTKPIDKIYAIFNNEIESKLWPMAIDKLFMVGKKTAIYLKQLGIYKIHDLITYPHQDTLKKVMKKNYFTLWAFANGQSGDEIETQSSMNKSLSHTHTFDVNTNDRQEIMTAIKVMIKSIQKQLVDRQWLTNTVMVNIKYEFADSHTKNLKLPDYTHDLATLTHHYLNLFEILWDQETSIRAISVGAQHLISSTDVVCQNKIDW